MPYLLARSGRWHTCTALYNFYYFYLHSSLLSGSTLIYSSRRRRSRSCCPSPAASSRRRTGRIISPLLLAQSSTFLLSSDFALWQPGNPINGQHPLQVTSGEEHRLRKVERWIRFWAGECAGCGCAAAERATVGEQQDQRTIHKRRDARDTLRDRPRACL